MGAFYGGSEEAETAYILGIDYDPSDSDDDGGYTGPDGTKYDSFHDYVTSKPVAGSTGSGVGYTTSTTESGGTKYIFDSDATEAIDSDFEIDTTLGTNISNVGNAGSDKDDDDKSSGCVIATHGISTGGFSKLDKAKAELWCERTYHGKWYGEAFRRGYRYAGNKAIEKGKAAKHYQEFKDFVSYGRGLKKGLQPAIKYYLRTTQFFLTGLFVN